MAESGIRELYRPSSEGAQQKEANNVRLFFVTPGYAAQAAGKNRRRYLRLSATQTAVIFVPRRRISLGLGQLAEGAAGAPCRGVRGSSSRRRGACEGLSRRRFQAAIIFVPRRRISLALGQVAVGALR